jgi:hypothetical protein
MITNHNQYIPEIMKKIGMIHEPTKSENTNIVLESNTLFLTCQGNGLKSIEQW